MSSEAERIAELGERISILSRAVGELTVVVETLAEIVAASNLAAARDMLTGDDLDDVGTQMKVHLVSVRDAIQQANRPRS